MSQLPIVVFSPVRWSSESRRPHHLVSRIARRRPVVFIEEPLAAEEGVPDSWDLEFPLPRLVVGRPVLEKASGGFDGTPAALLAGMTQKLLRWQDVREHVSWLYTPLALPLARGLAPSVVVYDCVEELAFLGGPREVVTRREAELLGEADVVFVEGRTSYRAKRSLHPNVHCLPGSVDAHPVGSERGELSWDRTVERMLREVHRASDVTVPSREGLLYSGA